MAYYPLKVKDSGGTVHVVGDPRTTSKADLASPDLTGVPKATTAVPDTNTTQIATTAYVVGQAASVAPAALGTAAVGTSTRFARADHAHALPTAANVGAIATTALTTTAPSALAGTAAAGVSTNVARLDHVHAFPTAANVGAAAVSHTHTSSAITAVDIVSQGASYTLVLGDASDLLLMTSATAQTVTIPSNSSVAFPVGTKIDIVQTGVGQCDIAPGAGVTLNSDASKRKINVQYAAVSCIKTATDTWLLIGALKA